MFRKRYVFGAEGADSINAAQITENGSGLEKAVRAAADNSNDFGEAVPVTPADLYCPEKGYGFVTEKNRRGQELLKFRL